MVGKNNNHTQWPINNGIFTTVSNFFKRLCVSPGLLSEGRDGGVTASVFSSSHHVSHENKTNNDEKFYLISYLEAERRFSQKLLLVTVQKFAFVSLKVASNRS